MFGKGGKPLKIAPQASSGRQRKSKRVELLSRKGLLPSNVKDDELATIHFQREFRSRFGSPCPSFFTGSLENAVNFAGGRGIDEEKLLAIYLHHDGSIDADRFSIHLMCSRLAADVLENNYVTWPWDLTDDSNKQRFLSKASNILDRGTMYDIGRLHKERCPIVLIARCRNKRCTVQRRMEGGASVEEFMAALTEEVAHAEQERRVLKEIQKQRAIRESILEQQRQEYEESLKADQRKAQEAKEQTELKDVNSVNTEKVRELELIQEKKIEAETKKLKKVLPKEPSHSRNVIKIRLRKPSGESCLTRKFSKTDRLQDLLNFVSSEGFCSKKYRILSLCPRREISSFNPKRPLKTYGFAKQETLIIEEK